MGEPCGAVTCAYNVEILNKDDPQIPHLMPLLNYSLPKRDWTVCFFFFHAYALQVCFHWETRGLQAKLSSCYSPL